MGASRRASLNPMCRAALRYAERGWRVFPVGRDKKPKLMGGAHAGTTDRDQIRTWWFHPQGTIPIAISTGPESGIWVLDIDPRNGGDQSLRELVAEHGRLPKTLQARTASGGRHFYFKYPKLVTIRNSAGKVGPGIDHRGRNGYVVAPPSVVNHGSYEWLDDLEPAPSPPWLECLTLPPKQRPFSGLFLCEHCGEPHQRRPNS